MKRILLVTAIVLLSILSFAQKPNAAPSGQAKPDTVYVLSLDKQTLAALYMALDSNVNSIIFKSQAVSNDEKLRNKEFERLRSVMIFLQRNFRPQATDPKKEKK